MSRFKRFLVDIEYREPEYEMRQGRRSKPFRWRYSVDASCADHATAIAVSEFKYIASISSVSWTRDIVSVSVSDSSS